MSLLRALHQCFQHHHHLYSRREVKHSIRKMEEVDSKIRMLRGDITNLEVDVIVNAANRHLMGGGGVDGAIHDAAGYGLRQACRELGVCEVGEAKITGAFRIKTTKAIIHVVGPRLPWGRDKPDDEEKELLADCYTNALELAKKNGLRSIAFPCVSTGIYSFPNKEAAEIALHATKSWLAEDENGVSMDSVVFCVFLAKDEKIYRRLLNPAVGEDDSEQSDKDSSFSEFTGTTASSPNKSGGAKSESGSSPTKTSDLPEEPTEFKADDGGATADSTTGDFTKEEDSFFTAKTVTPPNEEYGTAKTDTPPSEEPVVESGGSPTQLEEATEAVEAVSDNGSHSRKEDPTTETNNHQDQKMIEQEKDSKSHTSEPPEKTSKMDVELKTNSA